MQKSISAPHLAVSEAAFISEPVEAAESSQDRGGSSPAGNGVELWAAPPRSPDGFFDDWGGEGSWFRALLSGGLSMAARGGKAKESPRGTRSGQPELPGPFDSPAPMLRQSSMSGCTPVTRQSSISGCTPNQALPPTRQHSSLGFTPTRQNSSLGYTPTRQNSTLGTGGTGLMAPASHGQLGHVLQKHGTRTVYFAVLLVLSLYASVLLEGAARRVAKLHSNAPPSRAQALINLIGTGQIVNPSQVALEDVVGTVPAVELQDDPVVWVQKPILGVVPVVLVSGHVPNEPNHPTLRVLKQARALNDLVYIVGPSSNLKHLTDLGVIVEPRADYNSTMSWIFSNLGEVRQETMRWWVVREFMRRHNYSRIFYLGAEVMLYANITEYVNWAVPNASVMLPKRWPSMRPPLVPSQYVSTAISGHIALWTKEALDDFLAFFQAVLRIGLFGGRRGSKKLVNRKEYFDMTILAWYAYSDCWLSAATVPCMAEEQVGISPSRARRMRQAKFVPRFQVESFCQPRMCQNTSWSDPGPCVFDNNFSVTSPSRLFIFKPPDKCPTSKHYEHFEAWMGDQRPKLVQFLAVHFQGSRRKYMMLDDPDPSRSWGASTM